MEIFNITGTAANKIKVKIPIKGRLFRYFKHLILLFATVPVILVVSI